METDSLKSTASTENPGLGLDAPTGSPRRIWRRRIKGWRMPANTVSVCRPSKYSNPFIVGKPHPYCHDDTPDAKPMTAEEAVECFKALHWTQEELDALRGKNLACFCKPGSPCHATVLLGLANS